MHKQITAADRKAIEVLLKRNCTLTEIGKSIGVHKSTICREINKRGTPNGYFADIAQINYETQRKRCVKLCKLNNRHIQKYTLSRMRVGWSPEQISGRMKFERTEFYVCPETIYNWLYTDPWAVENKWYQYLRRGKKKRTRKGGRKTHKCKIPNRISIHKRPKIVDKRKELGHWEGDSVVYTNKYAINTVNELKTGLVAFRKLKRKTAELTANAMILSLDKYVAKTLTLDNGSEFTQHQKVSAKTNVKVFFCDPYSSWQRGSNENSNMLLRGYLPKRSNIEKLSQQELDNIAEELNNRPRKRLGFRTPFEVYQSEISNLLSTVAFETRL